MIRCRGSGHGGSARSAPDLPRPPPLRLRLPAAGRVLLRPPHRPLLHWSPLLPSCRRMLNMPVRPPCVGARQLTSQRSRPSTTPLPRLRLRPSPQPPPPTRPQSSPPRRRSTSRRPHRWSRRWRRMTALLVLRPPMAWRCLRCRHRSRRVLRRWPVRRRRSQCPRRTPAPPRPRKAPVARRLRLVRRCVRRLPVCPTDRALLVPACRRAAVQVRVVAHSVARVPLRQPHHRSAVRLCVRPVVALRVLVVVHQGPAPRRVLVVIRAAVAARRASVGRSIRPPLMPTFRRP